MGNLVERSSQPDLITGTHLALLENLDPDSKFVTAHAQYHIQRQKKRDSDCRQTNAKRIQQVHSVEWSIDRKKSQRTGDYIDPDARYLPSNPIPSLKRKLRLEDNTVSTDRITLQHVCLAVQRLKNSQHMGSVGSYSVRRRDFLQLFCGEDGGSDDSSISSSTIIGNGLEKRVRNIWNVWCEAAAEDDSQQARVDAMQLLAGLIWLVPGSVGKDRLRAAVELFDPRWKGNINQEQNIDQPRNRNKPMQLSLSKMEVTVMIMTTLSGLCIWTDGFFIPPQATQINQIATAVFEDRKMLLSPSSSSTSRMNLIQLSQCAVALEQVSLERILCAEGLSVDLDDNTRSKNTRKSWMESFYYSSYDEKRMKLLMYESKDIDEIKGNRIRKRDIERPTKKDILEWKHTIVSSYSSKSQTKETIYFINSLSNIFLQSLTFTKLDQLNMRKMELLTMYLTMNWNSLKKLTLKSCQLNESMISLLSNGLSINNSIKILNLSNNNAGCNGGIAIGKALRQNESIIKLDISQNKLNDIGCKAIGEALIPYHLTTYSIHKKKKRKSCIDDNHSNTINTTIEIETNEDRIGRNDTLQCLDLRSNSIGTEGSLVFGDVLRTHPSLTSLNLRDNVIGDATLLAISDGILKSQYYIPLLRNMSIIKLGDRATCPLTNLNVSRNNIHDDGIVALSNTLSLSCNFTKEENLKRKLDFDQSNKKNQNYQNIFYSSRPNPLIDLITLNISSNKIRGRGAVALSNAIISCPSLTYLNLSDNKIGFHYAGSKYEKNINYEKNVFNYDTRGSIAIANAIDHNNTLTHLDLSMNSIDTVGGRTLLESLQWSEYLEVLNLSGNEMSQTIVNEQDEIGDPRLNLTHQKCMRMKGNVSLSVPTRINEDINSSNIGTGGLSVVGHRRSYHAGGESISQTNYHYELTRWSNNTKIEQMRRARKKYLPADDNDTILVIQEKGTTALQDKWNKLMKFHPDPLHDDSVLNTIDDISSKK
jgi:Ran GTPase-activating protein (RanGAP) involved in mRNA processing and transport